ncbi:MAG: penicillin-binding protein 1C [Alphaproteobacteria bacterium]|nr:penicillin-binding protein 1C [Alphaproteobacteria bacterium]
MKRAKRSIIITCAALLVLFAGGMLWALYSKPPLLQNTSFSTAYYDRSGALLRLTLAEDDSYRLYTKLEDISPDLIEATLLQEDRYFYRHPGVNPVSLVRGAYETYVRRSRSMGGSTITMQVVRMRDNLDTRSVVGKLWQILAALRIEAHYSKKDILEAYFNLAPYGGNIYGAGTASLIYFKQSAKNLALPQSLALAVIPQNPIKRFPLRADNSAWQEARLRLFGQLPSAQATQYAPFMKMPLTAFGRDDLPFLAPHFVDGLVEEADEGAINTTLDLGTQKKFERAVKSYLDRHKSQGFDNAVAMLVDTRNMAVRSLVGSGDFFNAAIEGQVDGTLARRSPGSTLKPFVYALALEQGLIHPETLLDDDPAFFAEYRPGNFDNRFVGKIPAREALVLSRNIPAISLAQKLSTPDLYGFLQKAGAGFPENRKHYGLSIVVGGAEIDMRGLVRFYAMLANGGVLKDLRYTKNNNASEPISMLSPEAALVTLSMLEQDRPGMMPFTNARRSLPVYWKTGTSNGFRDAWTVGVFGPYVLAVWVGHFDGHANPALIGSQAATPLFFDLVRTVENREKLADIVGPALTKLNVARLSVCPDTGELRDCGMAEQSWFIPGKSPFFVVRLGGDAPEILSPREGISYAYSYHHKDQQSIPLEAKNTRNEEPLYWFADNKFLGTADPQAPLFWTPQPGEHTIRVVDTKGRADSRAIKVIVSE